MIRLEAEKATQVIWVDLVLQEMIVVLPQTSANRRDSEVSLLASPNSSRRQRVRKQM